MKDWIALDWELLGVVVGVRRLAKKEGPLAQLLLERSSDLEVVGISCLMNDRSGCAYATRDIDIARHAIALENQELGGGATPVQRQQTLRQIGDLLGYPTCCATAFGELARQDDSFVMAHLLENANELGQMHHLLNFLPPLVGPVFHYPCRLDCDETLNAAKFLASERDRLVPGSTTDLARELAHPVLSLDRLDFLVFDGRIKSTNEITYRGYSRANDYIDEMHCSPRFAVFADRLPPTGTIRIDDRTAIVFDDEGREIASFLSEYSRPRILDYSGR